jgi:DNA-binding MarR family transcriptional regulator
VQLLVFACQCTRPKLAQAQRAGANASRCGSRPWVVIRPTTIQENVRDDYLEPGPTLTRVNCIAVRYTNGMAADITTDEYRALAELRYRIRHFLREGDVVAQASGLEPQQYLLLLTIRGLPEGEEATIRTLAERLALKHHSVVELIDRLETHGYVRRSRGRDDRRRVLVSLLPRGERLLEQVARHRIGELRATGHALVRAIDQLLEKPPSANHKKSSSRRPKRR